MALFDQKYQLRYNLLFTVIAITFGISFFSSLYIGLSGWYLTGWDILRLTAPPNLLSLSSVPLLFLVSSISMSITLKFLLTRNFTNNKKSFLVGSLISSACGLIMLTLTAITLGLSSVVKDPNNPIFIDYFTHPFLKIPFLGAFVGLFLSFTLFGIIIAWHSPIPKQTNEIDSWREYIEKNPLPWKKWFKVYLTTVCIINTIFPLIYFAIHIIIPNPITQLFFNDTPLNLLIAGISVLFPGPFLYTLVFLFLYRKPLLMKLNLFLLSIRTEQTPIKSTSQVLNIQNREEKMQQNHSGWKLFGTFTIMEVGFIAIFTILRFAIWSEVIILSFWSAFFLYSMFLLIQYT